MEHKTYTKFRGSVYCRTNGSNVIKFICKDNDIDKWQVWCDEVGAEKGSVEDMLSIGDDEPSTGYCEPLEILDGPRNHEEEDEDGLPIEPPADGGHYGEENQGIVEST
jgi:hypothetical protein